MGMVPPVRPGALWAGGWVHLLRPVSGMTLKELSIGYREAGEKLRRRLRVLRAALKTVRDPEERWHIRREIAELTPVLTQMNELAELTEHYYERGYWRNEKYTL